MGLHQTCINKLKDTYFKIKYKSVSVLKNIFEKVQS